MANMPRKLDGKELEDFQVQELIDGIRRRLARLEAEAEAAAKRYTVVFEIGSDLNGYEGTWWRAYAIDRDITTAGKTIEEAAVLMARKLTALWAAPVKEEQK